MCALGTSNERLRRQIDFFSPFVGTGAAILEIGCATGELAAATRSALNPARYDAIEFSPAAEVARPRVDRLFHKPLGDLLATGEITNSYDLLLMSHVLEHIDEPAAELAAMKRILEPSGAIFIEVPNGAGNRRLPIDDNSSHLQFFSPASLIRILSNVGLETIATATDVRLDARYTDSLQVVAKPFHIPRLTPTLLSDHPAIVGESEIIVWGAGSLVEELLANFFDASKIAYFIDRDPTKRGAMRLGKPVKGPEDLPTSPITILINSIDFAPSIVADIGRLQPNIAHRLVPIERLLTRP
jgi:SAM-dependent methyltransferase